MEAEFPEKLGFLFEPHRYKIAWGGRGGAKSWNFARALVIMAARKPMRILCARELQKSIQESVHHLLVEQIDALNLRRFVTPSGEHGGYDVQEKSIKGLNGSEFLFEGLRYNIDGLKSMEGVDICWVEEAADVSSRSWEKLIPTIRKDGSEIWVSFNPELESDETYQRFVLHPPRGAQVVEISWRDNPWFPPVLREEMEELKERDRDAWLNVWEGHPRVALEGAIYANELRDATEANRITSVPYDLRAPVHVFVDLGWSDFTSLIFVQRVGLEYRVLRAYQNRQQLWAHYLNEIRTAGYAIDTIWLPHDARAHQLGTGKSIEELTREAGFTARIVPQLSVEDGINALRTLFPTIWWDRDKCDELVQALRHYRYDLDDRTGTYARKPLHDNYSHYADAARYFAVGMKDSGRRTVKVELAARGEAGELGWMR